MNLLLITRGPWGGTRDPLGGTGEPWGHLGDPNWPRGSQMASGIPIGLGDPNGAQGIP